MKRVEIKNKRNLIINEHIGRFVDNIFKKGGSYYRNKRNAYNFEKMKYDNFLGKKGEVFARRYLIEEHNYPRDIRVDLRVYDERKKNWDADLNYGRVEGYEDIHIKSCSKSTYDYVGDYSWTFQYNNSIGEGGRDDLFLDKKGEDIIGFVYMDDCEDNYCFILGFYRWKDIVLLLKDPMKKTLKGIKKCLYYKDLKKIKSIL